MDFQGFQSGISFWFVLAILVSVVLISWISYRNYSSIPPLYKVVLSSLRALALLIVFVLLLNPFFTTNKTVQVKPKIALLLDSSVSTSINKGDYNGTQTYFELIGKIFTYSQNNDINLETYSFGNSVSPVSIEGFTNTAAVTDIYEAIDYLNTSDQDYTSAILVSDGIITRGKNPIVEAGNSLFPIHTIAIGDSQQVKDIRISDLISNETGFTNTEHLVNIDISQYGFNNYNIDVILQKNGTQIDRKSINLANQSVQSVEFTIPLNEAGLHQYQIEIPAESNEWNNDNNRATFSIEVLDSKTRILHLASAIHPDIKAFRSILATNENIELEERTYLGNSNLDPPVDPNSKYDLIIVHGALPSSWVAKYQQVLSETSTLFVLLPNQGSINYESNFTIIQNNAVDLFDVTLSINASQSDHPILDISEIDLQRLPSLLAPIRAEKSDLLVRSLLNTTFQRIETDSPLLAISETANIRRAHLNASGYYRLYQSTNEDIRNFTIELITNIVNWASTNPDNRLLKIRSTKNDYSTGENPLLNGTLINESGELESNGIIEVNIQGDDYNTDFTMNNEGDGSYRLELPNLSPGRYNYTAIASKGSREIDTQSGQFLINETNLELANTVRNDLLLRSIASNSNGLFIGYKQIDSFWDQLSSQSDFSIRTEISEYFIYPVYSLIWFLVVVTLLSVEWILRKKFALP